ncbi:fumarylacetoacetate hydrolase family protein [Palleronia sp. LCG004]|uniref:fumarylacetoacetate hydrolase family protein n=1 Tax=Palleronia sp. LCG004 TaxID=3079304 RepID=UPI002943959B|nr:fumarylacetoacetate hydrolase family protein [Palleronia sp. LCG004]WOI57725.1 fumarylacetoacetate hydrolase family protein [Palleronia sp. LCG004]
MKLATLSDGTRDGRLVAVSRDLSRCAPAPARTLQSALDDWEAAEPELRALFHDVEDGNIDAQPFDQASCLSPLPRAYQWADGSAYVNHVDLVRRARGAEMPESFWTDPLMYQGGSDGFVPPHAPIRFPAAAVPDWGVDMEGEIAVVLDDCPMGIDADAARDRIRLVMLANDVSLRGLIPGELAKGFGFFQSKPASSFSPVAVTPDALGDAWRDGKLHLPLRVDLNGTPFGRADAGIDMTFDFGRLIEHAARSRALGAGTIVGSGTVSNRDPDGGPGRPVAEGGRGYSCIAEIRMIETIAHGAPSTPFLRWGDRVRIEMHDDLGRSIFGAIDQTLETL